MKHPKLRRLSSLAVLLLATACSNDAPDHLHPSTSMLDFGRVLHGDTVRQAVELRNGAPHPIAITRIWANCSCFEVPAFGRMLQAGETREVVVIFRSALVPPERLRGKKLTIQSNDALRPEIEVDLTGEVIPSCSLTPGLLKLGTLEAPVTPQIVRLRPGPEMTLELLSVRAQPLDVLAVTSKPAADAGFDLEVSLKPGATGRDDLHGSVEVKVRASGGGFDARNLDYIVRVQGKWPGE